MNRFGCMSPNDDPGPWALFFIDYTLLARQDIPISSHFKVCINKKLNMDVDMKMAHCNDHGEYILISAHSP